jgi:flagellar protein FlgJ
MGVKEVREETVPTLLNRLKDKNSEDKKLKKACSDFEAVFVGYMMKSMSKTIPQDTNGAMGNQRDIYQSMYEQELATQISKSRKSFGIGEAMYRELSKRRNAQETQAVPETSTKK